MLEEHSPVGTILGVVVASDDDRGEALDYAIVSGNGGGSFAIDSSTGEITVSDNLALVYEVNPQFVLTIQVTDTSLLSDTAQLTVSLVNVNAPPVTVDDNYAVDQATALNVEPAGVLENDVDIDADSLQSLLVAHPAHGTLVFNSDGSFTYVPDPDFVGTDSFLYRPADGLEHGTVGRVTIVVNSLALSEPGASGSEEGLPYAGSLADVGDHSDLLGSSSQRLVTDTGESSGSGETKTPRTTSGSTVMAAPWQPPLTETEEADFVDTDDSGAEKRSKASSVTPGYADQTGIDRSEAKFSCLEPARQVTGAEFQTEILWHGLDRLQSDLLEDARSEEMFQSLVIGTTAVGASALVVGYVAWALRAGSLLSAMLSALPAWTMFDPVPILDRFEDADASRNPTEEDGEMTFESLLAHD
jgi:hypothetical protein